MAEQVRSSRELLPPTRGFLALLEKLSNSPPPGFKPPSHRSSTKTQGQPTADNPIYHATHSFERVPGYPSEPVYRFQYWSNGEAVFARARLPGPPLDEGTPTLREYTLSPNGTVQRRRFSCPPPDKIRQAADMAIAAITETAGLGEFGPKLASLINTATGDNLRDKEPEVLEADTCLEPEEVEALNQELLRIVLVGVPQLALPTP